MTSISWVLGSKVSAHIPLLSTVTQAVRKQPFLASKVSLIGSLANEEPLEVASHS